MRIAAIALLAALATAAHAQSDPKTPQRGPETRWFNLDRSSTGYIAAGNLAGTFWAFHVRGLEMKRLAPTTFSLDGVIIQVRAIPRTVVKGGVGPAALDAHKAYEQKHIADETRGVTFRDHAFCRDAKVPYQQWVSQVPGGISEAFVTFLVGSYVLMVGAPYENSTREAAAERAIGQVCSTFRTERARKDPRP